MSFRSKLQAAARKNNSWLCVGLDPDLRKLPSGLKPSAAGALEFNRAIIGATSDLVCAYKPNSAFYECLGAEGWEILRETIRSIPSHIPVIVDAKRGDIGNTAAMYAKAVFEWLGADAVTVNPYLGRDSVEPFASYMEKGVFVLCLTSNESSSEIQQRLILLDDNPDSEMVDSLTLGETLSEVLAGSARPVYHHVAELACAWNEHDNIGLVVGATLASELGDVRAIVGDAMPVLIPGVGAQGGDLNRSIELGSNKIGELAVINVARGIIYSWSDHSGFERQIRKAAVSYKEEIERSVAAKLAQRS